VTHLVTTKDDVNCNNTSYNYFPSAPVEESKLRSESDSIASQPLPSVSDIVRLKQIEETFIEATFIIKSL